MQLTKTSNHGLLPLDVSLNRNETQRESNGISQSQETSASAIDNENFKIDPNAVDFEPLLVSGTGKILSYHTASFYDYEDSNDVRMSVTSSVKKNHINDENSLESNDTFQWRRVWCNRTAPIAPIFDVHSCSFSHLVRFTSLILSVFIVSGGLLLLDFFTTDYSLQQKIAKLTAKNIKHANLFEESQSKLFYDINESVNNIEDLKKRMININNVLASSAKSDVVILIPALTVNSISSTKEILENFSRIIYRCFSRSVFQFNVDMQMISGALPDVNTSLEPSLESILSPSVVILTPFFQEIATTLFDKFHQGLFITILRDPVDIYAEEYALPPNKRSDVDKIDNMLIRVLTGFTEERRKVNELDFNVARELLTEKIILISCDNPNESLRRLSLISRKNGRNPSHTENVAENPCMKEASHFDRKCRKIHAKKNEIIGLDQNTLAHIKAKHHFDISLYEYSKLLFDEQKVLFPGT